jgi:hypothetical protein
VSDPELRVVPGGEFLYQLFGTGYELTWWHKWLWLLWRRPRAFYAKGVVYVLPDARGDARLLAHEYGHHLGLEHPRNPILLLFDVMGLGWRVLDRHGLMERSREWRRGSA